MEFPREEELLKQLFNDVAFKKFISANDFIEGLEWDNWFNQQNKYSSVKDQARLIYRIRFYENSVFNGANLRREVWNKIDEKINNSPTKPIRSISALKKWLPYAAIFAAVLFVAIWWMYKPSNDPQKNYSFATNDNKESFLLPDHTKLILNKNSRAIYSSNDSLRLLKVYGEGYLEVAKVEKTNKRIPFKVENDGFVVEVLGTQFNFIGSAKSKNVALFEGSVKVSDTSGELIIKPGEVVHSVDGKLSKLSISSDLFMAWNTGILKLNNTTLKDIIEWIKISQDRDFEIQLSSNVLSQTISGEIEISNEGNLYKTLGNLYNLNVSQIGNKVIIKETK